MFHWSLIAATWDDEVAAKLMTMIVELWVTVKGFSLASAWIERYKGATKKTLQKAKPLQKQILIPLKFLFLCVLFLCALTL